MFDSMKRASLILMSAAISRPAGSAGEKSGAGHPRSEPSPRQGVDPEVALQVQQGPSSYVTDRRDLLVPEPDAAGAEPGEVVELALGVDRGHASHSRWFAANDAACPPRSVITATRGRGHPGRGRRSCRSGRGCPSGPGSGLLLARRGAQLLLEPIDPATGEAVEGDPGWRPRPRSTLGRRARWSAPPLVRGPCRDPHRARSRRR